MYRCLSVRIVTSAVLYLRCVYKKKKRKKRSTKWYVCWTWRQPLVMTLSSILFFVKFDRSNRIRSKNLSSFILYFIWIRINFNQVNFFRRIPYSEVNPILPDYNIHFVNIKYRFCSKMCKRSKTSIRSMEESFTHIHTLWSVQFYLKFDLYHVVIFCSQMSSK